jgi:hypothetical protein
MTKKLSQILAKTERFGDCRLWTGGMVRGTYPRMYAVVNGKECQISVRRVVWNLLGKGELGPTEVIGMTCGNEACLNGRHMVRSSKSDAAKRGWEKPGTRLKVSMAQRKKPKATQKLDMGKARQVRERLSQGLRQADVAQEFGISQAMVSRVALGQSWKEYGSAFAGMFTGLLASNDSARRAA